MIVNASHRSLAEEQLEWAEGVSLVVQPQDRGTAAGVLLPVLHVLERDPDATVTILPSDHGILDGELFNAGLMRARKAVESRPELIVIGGVEASSPRPDYGWIVHKGPRLSAQEIVLLRVSRFIEKPPMAIAEVLFSAGALWSTFVLVAKAGTLLELFRTHLGPQAELLEQGFLRKGAERQAWLSMCYSGLTATDFSSNILSAAGNLAVLAWPERLGWIDLGTPERLLEWMARPENSIRDSWWADAIPRSADIVQC